MMAIMSCTDQPTVAISRSGEGMKIAVIDGDSMMAVTMSDEQFIAYSKAVNDVACHMPHPSPKPPAPIEVVL